MSAHARTSGEGGKALVWVLGFLAAAAAGLAGLIGIGCALDANSCPWGDEPRVATTDGRELWFAMSCAACHGRDGTGGRGPSLVSGPRAQLSQEELEAKILRGRPLAGMPSYKRSAFTREQVAAVAAYVVALRGGNGPPGTPSPEGP